VFASPADFNAQLQTFLAGANTREHRALASKGCAAGARDSKAAPDPQRRARGWCTPRVNSTRQRQK
jgi:hypothetical protein